MSNISTNVVMQTPETDMFVTTIAASNQLPTNLCIWTNIKGQAYIISNKRARQSVCLQYDVNNMKLAAKSILGSHAFTECDTTSAFCSRCKVKPSKILLRSRVYFFKFANISVSASHGDDELSVFQRFVFDLYGH